MKLFNNKKANFVDVIEAMPIFLFIGFCLVIVFLIISNINDGVQASTSIQAEAKVGIQDLTTAFPKYYDFLTIAFYIIFVGFSVYSARLIPSNPFFMLVAIIFLIVAPFLAMIGENIWDAFTQQTLIATKITSIPITNFFLNHLLYFILFYSFIVGIALLTKDEVQQ